MGIAGSITPTGGAPKPDPARVAAIRYTIVDEPETCAAFGETARASLASLNDRTLAETRNGDLGECGLLLDHVRDRVAGLDPARLEPRSGLAGLFDSRGKRLKTFRAAYASAAAAVTQSAVDINDRAGALARKGTALETLWSETRDAIAELDAHIAAARGWLANEARTSVAEALEAAGPEPVVDAVEPAEVQAEAEVAQAPADESIAAEVAAPDTVERPEMEIALTAVPETGEALAPATSEPVEGADGVVELAPEAETEPERATEPSSEAAPEIEPEPVYQPASVVSLPHPLETRLAALEAVRATAIGRLPLLRAAQNADCRAPAALKEICDGVEAWRADWQEALGLAGKRPKKVRPDRVRLTQAASALTDRIDATGRELSAAQGRRAELQARVAPAPSATSLAA